MDELLDRLGTAATGLEALRDRVVAREPWPLSGDYGTEPESDWGPKEVLAHVAEMLPYWLRQLDDILAAPAADGPPAFGRVATDANRLARIGADRELPASELFDRAADGVEAVQGRLREWSSADLARAGVHARLGEMTVLAIVERFIAGHLEEHVRQLDEVLRRD